MEGNAFSTIENLEALVNLRCLYIHENCINSMKGISVLPMLGQLNLSDNMLEKVEDLEQCSKLTNLSLKRNRIGFKGVSDVENLLTCPTIT